MSFSFCGLYRLAALCLILLTSALMTSPLLAADCSAPNITLSTQAEVDAFQATYGGATPPCDTVTGDLRIGGADIANVDGLSALTSVGGDLIIYYNGIGNLTNVDGLSALTSVGGELSITANTALTNVDGLAALTSVGGHMYINNNTVLTNVDGLSDLTSVGWFVNIYSNAALTNVDGLSALTSVGNYFYIQSNAVLTNLDGLAALISVETDVLIQNNPQLAVCYALAPLLDDVDDALPGPGPWPYPGGVPDVGGYPRLINNLPGCNTVAQILSARPPDGTAVLAIQKVFSDGNDETDVTLKLHCTSGSYAPAVVTVAPETGLQHIFVIDELPLVDGAGVDCTVVEEPVAGYTAQYRCPTVDSMSATDPSCEPDGDTVPADNFACSWTNVQAGDSNNCMIVNAPTPVKVEVTKVWEEYGAGGINFDRDATITVACTAEIVSGDFNGKYWTISKDLDDSDGDYDDKDGKDVGLAKVTAKVIPTWYATATPPAKQQYTKCWASESGMPSSVDVSSDCGDTYETAGMQVSLGTGDSCTITNTQFFEGIPTLNQWGMAIMALLMLGVGMVGFRRFV